MRRERDWFGSLPNPQEPRGANLWPGLERELGAQLERELGDTQARQGSRPGDAERWRQLPGRLKDYLRGRTLRS